MPHFSVSCQHYSFAVNAFVDVIREFDAARYDFTLREEQTHEIIEDVAHMKSELGILYLSEHNREVIERMLVANELVFEGLFCATPHVFVCADHPLAGRSSVTLEDLEDYPFLSYEQGSYNSFYYSEELTSTFERRKNIRVRDRATLFNLAMGLNGYTVCSGVISHELNGPSVLSRFRSMWTSIWKSALSRAKIRRSRAMGRPISTRFVSISRVLCSAQFTVSLWQSRLI